jgi:hypothetical protein
MIQLDELRAHPLFADLSDALLQWLRDQLTELSIAAGEVLAREGETRSTFYVVLGVVVLFSAKSGGSIAQSRLQQAAACRRLPRNSRLLKSLIHNGFQDRSARFSTKRTTTPSCAGPVRGRVRF